MEVENMSIGDYFQEMKDYYHQEIMKKPKEDFVSYYQLYFKLLIHMLIYYELQY